jgi:hypothetical protein
LYKPHNATDHYYRGYIYDCWNQPKNALEEYYTALAMEPKNAKLMQVIQEKNK